MTLCFQEFVWSGSRLTTATCDDQCCKIRVTWLVIWNAYKLLKICALRTRTDTYLKQTILFLAQLSNTFASLVNCECCPRTIVQYLIWVRISASFPLHSVIHHLWSNCGTAPRRPAEYIYIRKMSKGPWYIHPGTTVRVRHQIVDISSLRPLWNYVHDTLIYHRSVADIFGHLDCVELLDKLRFVFY